MGYDYLALYVFTKRGSVKRVIGKVGVGKESGTPLKSPKINPL
jgi:RIO-like serine/threonine protein kinase